MGMRVAVCETPFVWSFPEFSSQTECCFSKRYHRNNLRFVHEAQLARIVHCLFSPTYLFLRCAVCVVKQPLLLDGSVRMLLGCVRGLFGINAGNLIWCRSVTRSSLHTTFHCEGRSRKKDHIFV